MIWKSYPIRSRDPCCCGPTPVVTVDHRLWYKTKDQVGRITSQILVVKSMQWEVAILPRYRGACCNNPKERKCLERCGEEVGLKGLRLIYYKL